MDRIKKSIFILLGVLFCFVLISRFFISNENKEAKKTTKYFNDFDVKLKGKVFYKEKVNAGLEIYCLSVLNSNYKNFDQSDSLSKFYILVNEQIAVLYDGAKYHSDNPKINEIIEIDGGLNSFSIIDTNGIVRFQKEGLWLPDFFPRNRMKVLFQKYKNGNHASPSISNP